MEQTVCGIDHIGTVVFDHPQIVEEMADMRDDGMARTRPGREWLELFDRLQGPVLAAVLADESLLEEAGRLFDAAAGLVERDTATIIDNHIEGGLAFLLALRKRLPAELHPDLAAVERRLATSKGRTLSQLVKQLGRTGPHKPPRAVKGSRTKRSAG